MGYLGGHDELTWLVWLQGRSYIQIKGCTYTHKILQKQWLDLSFHHIYTPTAQLYTPTRLVHPPYNLL